MQFVKSLLQASVDHLVQSITCLILALNRVSRFHLHSQLSITMSLQRLFTLTLMMIIQNLRHMLSVDSSLSQVMETRYVLALKRLSAKSLMQLLTVHTSLFSLTVMVMQKIVLFRHCYLQQLFTITSFVRRLVRRLVLLLRQAMFAKCTMLHSLLVLVQQQ